MIKRIAIVAGEPFSINSEIIAKSWRKIRKKYKKNIFIIGNYSLIKKQFNKLKIKISTARINTINKDNSSKSLKIFDVPLKPGYVLKCIDKAHELAINKKIVGFVNCPVNKNIFKSKKYGVTEYLAKKNGVRDSAVMMIYNKNLSVVPVSTHIPIKEISQKLKYLR